MKLSNKNAKALLLDMHQDIEEYADVLVTNIFDKKDFSFLTYPPNGALTELEIAELEKLVGNVHLKNALRKVIADNSAGVIFNLLNLLDGTVEPRNVESNWTGLLLVDKQTSNAETVNGFLHDNFFETYWDWKNNRGNKD